MKQKHTMRLVVQPKQAVLINDTTLVADERGIIDFSENQVLRIEASIHEFDRLVGDILSKEQQALFYEYIAVSRYITLTEISTLLGIDRATVKEICSIGLVQRVMKRTYNNAWTTIEERRNELRTLAKRMQMSQQPIGEVTSENPLDDIALKHMARSKKKLAAVK